MKVIIIDSGKQYSTIQYRDDFRVTIKKNFSDKVYKYFDKNKNNNLSISNLTICTLIGVWVPGIYDNNSYAILKDDKGNMCIVKDDNSYISLLSIYKLDIMKQIFEYYEGDY